MSALRVVAAFVLAIACALPVFAQQAAPETEAAQPASLAGDYHLEGVMETGSGLRLQDDGTFQWFFMYGALDLYAKGTWSRAGDGIDLVVTDLQFPPQVPEAKFDRMHLRIDGDELAPQWPWDMDAFRKGEVRGSYVREE